MQLSLLLWVLGLKLGWSARFDEAFRKRIRDVDRIVVIRTQDSRRARSYIFRDNGVSVRAGVHPEATTELVWCDVRTAMRAMLSRNKLDTFSAIGRGDLAIHGNLQDALWFSDLAAP